MKEGVRFSLDGLADQNQRFSYEDWLRAGQRRTVDDTALAVERDKRIVADVNQRRIAKGQAPLTESQQAEMLSRLETERAATA
jgi:hypothetical protein